MSIDFGAVRVLLMEDEVFMTNIVARTLREIGINHLTTAKYGAEGLEILKAKSDEFDVVLLDLNMPKLSGQEVLRAIRASGEVANPEIPVIVLTGNAEEETVMTVARMRVSGYLVKPVSKKDLTLRLVKALAPPKPAA